MHNEILNFLRKHKELTTDKYVIEVGSLNVNGTARDVLPIKVGVDMREGKGVDFVCTGEDLPKHFKSGCIDVVVSTETLEHVRYWREFLLGVWDVLVPDGVFICTLASIHKGRHAYPDDYWRMSEELVRQVFADQEIIDIDPQLGRISFGFVIRKKNPLTLEKLKDIKLIPVDDKVPEELLV